MTKTTSYGSHASSSFVAAAARAASSISSSLAVPARASAAAANASMEWLQSTRAHVERAKVVHDHRCEAQKAKQERLEREASLYDRNAERREAAARAAEQARINTAAELDWQRQNVFRERQATHAEMKRDALHRDSVIRTQQVTGFQAKQDLRRQACAAQRRAALQAQERVLEANRQGRTEWEAERMHSCREAADFEYGLTALRKQFARDLRDASVHNVQQVHAEGHLTRSRSAAEMRLRSQDDVQASRQARTRRIQANVESAASIHARLSPARVQVMKADEVQRRRQLTGEMKERHRATEAAAFQSRAAECAHRQRLHDAIVRERSQPKYALAVRQDPLSSSHQLTQEQPQQPGRAASARTHSRAGVRVIGGREQREQREQELKTGSRREAEGASAEAEGASADAEAATRDASWQPRHVKPHSGWQGEGWQDAWQAFA